MMRMLLVSLATLALVLAFMTSQSEAGCTETKCCRGKDNSCRTQGPRLNRSNATTCFCDETCTILGDCCTDYQSVCRSEDCVLGDWEDWGECSEACDWGFKTRSRKVLGEPKFGGKECEATVQKTFCLGEKCINRRHGEGLAELHETGSIMPAQYSHWRQDKLYNPYNDIRKNLFQRFEKEQEPEVPSYCARFEIMETRKSCSNPLLSKPWASSLEVGQTVCVECQASAMRESLGMRCKGHGSLNIETRWNAVNIPGCHGIWMMTSEHRDCSCSDQDDHSFILI